MLPVLRAQCPHGRTRQARRGWLHATAGGRGCPGKRQKAQQRRHRRSRRARRHCRPASGLKVASSATIGYSARAGGPLRSPATAAGWWAATLAGSRQNNELECSSETPWLLIRPQVTSSAPHLPPPPPPTPHAELATARPGAGKLLSILMHSVRCTRPEEHILHCCIACLDPKIALH